MADQNLTPEEKLLRMIETPQGGPPPRPMNQRHRSLQDLTLNWKFLYEKYSKVIKERYQDYVNFRTGNILLFSICAVATIYFALDFILGAPRANAISQIQTSAKKIDMGDLSLEELAPLSIFTQEISQRNIFALPEAEVKTAVTQSAEQTQTTAEVAADATADLKLVGIIWSDIPQAMIEDSKEQRTHLVSRGNTIKDARVKEILKDRVILSYDSQDVELR
ncbi:MAG TPA: type II secretion system protein N [Candidatus Omnitrophota bacterium]|nr:type II secretion system protein N [Candidatus Omnitrophota bacterium]